MAIDQDAIDLFQPQINRNRQATQDNATQTALVASHVESNEARIKALEDETPPVDPPVDPPTGEWWDDLRSAAELIAAGITGAGQGATVHTSKQTVTTLLENFVVKNVNGRALQLNGVNAIARDFQIANSGSGVNDGSRIQSRHPAVHPMNSGSKKATFENFEVFGSPVNGLAGGNHPDTEVIIRRGHFRDNTTLGLRFTYPPAVAAAIKLFGVDKALLEDLFIENQAGAGAWVDGSNAHDVVWRRGLYQGIAGPSIFPELLKRALIVDPVIIGGEILIDAEDVVVTGAAMFATRGIRSRPTRRDGGRTISSKVSGCYQEFTPNSFYGWNGVPTNTSHSFLSGGVATGSGVPNTFRLNRDWKIFRKANARLTYAQWVDQTGNDADAEIIEVT